MLYQQLHLLYAHDTTEVRSFYASACIYVANLQANDLYQLSCSSLHAFQHAHSAKAVQPANAQAQPK